MMRKDTYSCMAYLPCDLHLKCLKYDKHLKISINNMQKNITFFREFKE